MDMRHLELAEEKLQWKTRALSLELDLETAKEELSAAERIYEERRERAKNAERTTEELTVTVLRMRTMLESLSPARSCCYLCERHEAMKEAAMLLPPASATNDAGPHADDAASKALDAMKTAVADVRDGDVGGWKRRASELADAVFRSNSSRDDAESDRDEWERKCLAAENHASNLAADNKELVRERDEARLELERTKAVANGGVSSKQRTDRPLRIEVFAGPFEVMMPSDGEFHLVCGMTFTRWSDGLVCIRQWKREPDGWHFTSVLVSSDQWASVEKHLATGGGVGLREALERIRDEGESEYCPCVNIADEALAANGGAT